MKQLILKFRNMRRWLKPRKGASLLDVLIGLVVLAITLHYVYGIMLNSSRAMGQNQRVSIAASLAEYKIEELRNENYASIVDGSDSGPLDALGEAGGEYSRAWTVAIDTPDTGLKTVTVVVAWSQWGESRNYSLTGVIAQ